MDDYNIENKYGSLIISSGQKPTLGLQAFAEYFSSFSGCVFMPTERRFYIYNQNNGLWEAQSLEAMISKISEEILDLASTNSFHKNKSNKPSPSIPKQMEFCF
ncbi:MAG: hypothetical protein E7039_03045 [Lentisphaerae bacterium]|nr:hypothetical protein [Lentisphaerota bacterium]